MFKLLRSTQHLIIRSTSFRCFSAQLTRITIPKTLSEDGGFKLLEKKHRQRRDKIHRGEVFVKGDKRIPMIVSKFKPHLNHYYNQRYRKRGAILLASDGWLKGHKYNGDEIKFLSYETNHNYKQITHKDDNLGSVTFKSMGVREELCKNLKEQFSAHHPNYVQISTIPKIMTGINVRCCFETGTGKTLAYAIPLVEKILKDKENQQSSDQQNDERTDHQNENYKSQENKKPKVLIIVPSRELGYQTADVFDQLTNGLNVGVATIFGSKPLFIKHSGYDIVITSLGMFQSNLKKAMYSLEDVKTLVIDEVDTMCDSSFSKDLSKLLAYFSFNNRDNPNSCQLVLVSATFPKYVNDVVGDFIDLKNIDVATSTKVNHVLGHVTHNFYRVDKRSRDKKLLELCYEFEADPGQTMIFVNRTPAALFVERYLNEHDLDCASFVKQRGNADQRFHNLLNFQDGRRKFLATTDLGSRGLDTRNVQHIINLDCPRFVTDYVHRAGRTGRINNRLNCSVHTFISFKPDVFMLQSLERSIREGSEIEGIDMDIKKFYKIKYDEDNDNLVDDNSK